MAHLANYGGIAETKNSLGPKYVGARYEHTKDAVNLQSTWAYESGKAMMDEYRIKAQIPLHFDTGNQRQQSTVPMEAVAAPSAMESGFEKERLQDGPYGVSEDLDQVGPVTEWYASKRFAAQTPPFGAQT